MTLITVTNLVLNFARACRSLVPALERAAVAWQDETQYDNWDRIAEPMFESLVIEPCVYAAVGEENIHTLSIAQYGFVSDGYFLDIGIPDDFERAQDEIGIFSRITAGWTLFLDRDGVINKKLDGDYVKTGEEFEFLPMALDALVSLSHFFDRLVLFHYWVLHIE